MEQNYNYYEAQPEKQGSIARGFLGAFLGALLGAAISCVVSVISNQVYVIIGFLIGLLVTKGYELLKGREGKLKYVIVILCIILAVVLSECVYYVVLIEKEIADLPTLVPQVISEELHIPVSMIPADLIAEATPSRQECYDIWLSDPEVRSSFLKDLGVSALFAAIGSIGLIVGMGKKKEDAQPVPADALPEQAQPDQDSDDYSADA